MKRRISRIISIILAVFILTSTCVVSVSAMEYRDLSIGFTNITKENASDVFGDGTVSFDEETSTLTLNNANIECDMNNTWSSSVISSTGYDLKIELIGKNTLKANGKGTDYITGINVYDGTLEIFGSGKNSSLTVDVSDSIWGEWGILVNPDETSRQANFTVKDTQVNVLCDKSEYISAVETYGPLTVSNSKFSIFVGGDYIDNCTALWTSTHYCNDEETGETVCAIPGDLNIVDNSEVVIEVADNNNENYGSIGIWTNNLKVDNSELAVDLGISSDSAGVLVCGDATFNNSKVNVSTADGCESTCGIQVSSLYMDATQTQEEYVIGGNFYINDGSNVSVNVGDASNYSSGIEVVDIEGSMQIKNSKVTVESGTISEEYALTYGISLFDRSCLYFHSGKLSVSVPEIPNLYGASAVAISGFVYAEDGVKVTGTNKPFENGTFELVQADSSVPIVFESKEEKILGDPNMDGKITVLDVTMIQRSVASFYEFDDETIVLADVDKDGKVTIFDATKVQRFLAQYITEF